VNIVTEDGKEIRTVHRKLPALIKALESRLYKLNKTAAINSFLSEWVALMMVMDLFINTQKMATLVYSLNRQKVIRQWKFHHQTYQPEMAMINHRRRGTSLTMI